MTLPATGNKFYHFVKTWIDDDKSFQKIVKGSKSPTVSMYKSFASALNENKSPCINPDKQMHEWDSSLSKKEKKRFKSEAVTLRRTLAVKNFATDVHYGRKFFTDLFNPDNITSHSAPDNKATRTTENDT